LIAPHPQGGAAPLSASPSLRLGGTDSHPRGRASPAPHAFGAAPPTEYHVTKG